MDFNELLYIVKEQIFLNIFFGCEVLNNFQTNESPNILFNPLIHFGQINTNWFLHVWKYLIYNINLIVYRERVWLTMG